MSCWSNGGIDQLEGRFISVCCTQGDIEDEFSKTFELSHIYNAGNMNKLTASHE